jgi:ATP adenylyltransferase
MEYLLESPAPGCLFCEKAAEPDEDGLILHRALHHYIILNLYPYTPAHLMLVPYRHVATTAGLSQEERAEAAALLLRIDRAMKDVSGADGANVGMNLGRCAGAGVEGHLHLHYVPRRSGDTEDGAAPEAAGLPEPLTVTFEKLRAALARP